MNEWHKTVHKPEACASIHTILTVDTGMPSTTSLSSRAALSCESKHERFIRTSTYSASHQRWFSSRGKHPHLMPLSRIQLII